MPETIISNISFINYAETEDCKKVYCLNSDVTADLVGAFSSEDNLIKGIEKAIKNGHRPSDLWGTIYPLDVLCS